MARRLFLDRRTPAWLLAAATVLAVPLLIHMQRDSGIWQDEWHFLLWRDGWSLKDVFGSFNGQLLPLTAIVFNLDRALFSVGGVTFLTTVSIAAQVALVWGMFAWLRTRLGEWLAAGLALLFLLYGSGYELLVWNFNFGWMIALSAGVWALVFYDREDSTKNRIAIALLLALSLAGNNNGLVFVAMILVQALYKEQRRRALATVAVPLGLWLFWWAVEGRSSIGHHVKEWPPWIASLVESAFSGITGSIAATNVQWGAPLAVLALTVGGLLLSRERSIRPALAGALAGPTVFIVLITLGRGGVFDTAASRYRYTLMLLIVLAFAELLRGARLRTPGAWLAFVVALGFCTAGNLVVMADGSASIRGGFEVNREYLTALGMVGERVATTTRYEPVDNVLTADDNDDVWRWFTEWGGSSFAFTPTEFAALPAGLQKQIRDIADQMRAMAPDAKI